NTFYRMGFGSIKSALEKLLELALYGSLCASIVFAVWGLWTWWRKREKAPLGPYLRAQAALERAGFPRQADQTPREFASAVSNARPTLAVIGELAERHYIEKYGGKPLDSKERERAESLLRELLLRL